MLEDDFPALYLSANKLSNLSQQHFYKAIAAQLFLLVGSAILSIISINHWSIHVLQLILLLGSLGCSIYLFSMRPDRLWYAGRAVAESIKTITWRYVSRAEPFQISDGIARNAFQQTLKAIIDQNQEVCQALTEHLNGLQITPLMETLRSQDFIVRRATYASERIGDQLNWYAKKASFNRRMSKCFFWALIITNSVAVIFALLRIVFPNTLFFVTDVFVAIAASLLSWMQAKRFSELAASYSLTVHEISLIREQSLLPQTEEAFSIFVGDTENAFSREHTQWVARKDV
jgi:hypothetical protein